MRQRVAVFAACAAVMVLVQPRPVTAGQLTDHIAKTLRDLRAFPHLDRAYRLTAEGRLADARNEFEQHLAIDPGDVAARTAYLTLLYRMRAFVDAIAQAAIVTRDSPRAINGWLYGALASQAAGDLRRAVEWATHASELARGARRDLALQTVVDASIDAGDWATAAEALGRLALRHDTFAIAMRQGMLQERLDEPAKAIDRYRHAASRAVAPQDRLSALKAGGRVALAAGWLDEARSLYASAAAIAPGDAALHETLASIATQRGDRAAAREEWQRVVASARTDSRRVAALLALGNLEAEAGQYAEAARAFERASAIDPAPDTLRAWAMALDEADQPKHAVAVRRRLTTATDDATDRFALGLDEVRAGDTRAGLEALRTAATSGTLATDRQAFAWRQIGLIHEDRKEYVEARQALERALALDATDAPTRDALDRVVRAQRDAIQSAILARAAAAIERGDGAAAAEAFHDAYVGGGEADWTLLDREADAWIAAGRATDAARITRTELTRSDLPAATRALVLERLGRLEQSLGDHAEAADAFGRAVALGRDDVELRKDYGYSLFALARWDEALDQFARLSGTAVTAEIRLQIMRCHRQLGDDATAVDMAMSLADADLPAADRSEVLRTAAYGAFGRGEFARAASLFAELETVDPDAANTIAHATAVRLAGDAAGAAALLDRLDVGSLSDADAVRFYDERAQAAVTLGDYTAAIDAEQRAIALQPSAARQYQLGAWLAHEHRFVLAIDAFSAAAADDPSNATYADALAAAYESLGYSQLQRGDTASAEASLSRAIDVTRGRAVESADARTAAEQRIAQWRAQNAMMPRSFEADTFVAFDGRAAYGSAYGDRITDPGFAGIEMLMRPARLDAVSGGRLALTSRILWPIGGSVSAGDAVPQLTVGVRLQPFRTVDAMVGVERVFTNASLPDEWLLRAAYALDPKPFAPATKSDWYRFVYIDGAYSTGPHATTAAYAEARAGRHYRLATDIDVAPHLVVDARTLGADEPIRRYLEGGIGVAFRYWFSETPHAAARRLLETTLQYRGRLNLLEGNGGGWTLTTFLKF